MSGPEMAYVDNRLLGVQLVKNGMSHAIMFDSYGNVQEPDDMMYRKNILVFRGRFRPVTYATLDIIRSSYRIFKRDEDYHKDNTLTMCEITLNNLTDKGTFDEKDFLDRVDQLNKIGQNVMISDFMDSTKLLSISVSSASKTSGWYWASIRLRKFSSRRITRILAEECWKLSESYLPET